MLEQLALIEAMSAAYFVLSTAAVALLHHAPLHQAHGPAPVGRARLPRLNTVVAAPPDDLPDAAKEVEPAAAAPSYPEECTPLALDCVVTGVLEPELASGIAAEPVAPFEFDTPTSAPIDPSTGLLPPGVELPVPIPAVEMPTIELPPPPAAPRTELPSLKNLAAFCLPTLGIWLASPLLSLIDTSVVSLNYSEHSHQGSHHSPHSHLPLPPFPTTHRSA